MSNYAFRVELKSEHQKPEKSDRTIRIAFATVMRQLKLSRLLGPYKLNVIQLDDVISASDRGIKPPGAAEQLMEIKRTLVSEGWGETNAGWYHAGWGGAFTILEALYKQTRSYQQELIRTNLTISSYRKGDRYEDIL